MLTAILIICSLNLIITFLVVKVQSAMLNDFNLNRPEIKIEDEQDDRQNY